MAPSLRIANEVKQNSMPTQQTAPTITYTVDCLEPGRHVYHVTLDLAGLTPGAHRLDMAVWTPGSYEVADYARHVFDMQAFDGHAEALALRKIAKSTWEFDAPTTSASIRYSVYAFELGTSTSHLDDSHAYWNGANLFFCVDQRPDLPVEIHVRAPAGWYASTGLTPDSDDPWHFHADNFDILLDSPVEVGTHRRYTFMVDQKVHTVAIWGSGNQDDEKLVADTRTIVETQAAMFGGLPYEHYTFIFHLAARGTGGLEHLNSTTCGFDRQAFRPWKRYRRALYLIAHEFFHLWNVKRIHPDMLGPFDYSQEVYTHLLWAMEGFTDYYALLSLRRSGLYTVKDYLEEVAEALKAYERQPGRYVMSLARSSFDTWLGEYRRGPDAPNRRISYYLKGSLVGIALDLEIRRRTQGQRSLDDVLCRLFERYGHHGQGFPESVYQETAEEVAGGSLAEFFGRYIEGVDELRLDEWLADAGLAVDRVTKNEELHQQDPEDEPPNPDEPPTSDPPLAWLGVETRDEESRLLVRVAYDPGPAAGQLYPEDELVALDDVRLLDGKGLEDRLRINYAPGDVVEIALFRRGQLLRRRVTLGDAPPNDYKIRRVKDPTPAQRALYAGWMGEDWPTPKQDG